MGESVLHCLGCPELIAKDIDAYVEIAVSLAGDTARRGELSKKIIAANAAGPKYYDSEWWSAEFGKLFIGIYEGHSAR